MQWADNWKGQFLIREIDLNGTETLSDVAYCECRNKKKSIETYFDILGRNVNRDTPFKIVRND